MAYAETVEPVVRVPALLNGFTVWNSPARRPDGDRLGVPDRAVLLHRGPQGPRLGVPVRRRCAVPAAAAVFVAATAAVSLPSSRVAWTVETVKLVRGGDPARGKAAPQGLRRLPRPGRHRGHARRAESRGTGRRSTPSSSSRTTRASRARARSWAKPSKPLSDRDMADLAAFYAAQPPAPSPASRAGDGAGRREARRDRRRGAPDPGVRGLPRPGATARALRRAQPAKPEVRRPLPPVDDLPLRRARQRRLPGDARPLQASSRTPRSPAWPSTTRGRPRRSRPPLLPPRSSPSGPGTDAFASAGGGRPGRPSRGVLHRAQEGSRRKRQPFRSRGPAGRPAPPCRPVRDGAAPRQFRAHPADHRRRRPRTGNDHPRRSGRRQDHDRDDRSLRRGRCVLERGRAPRQPDAHRDSRQSPRTSAARSPVSPAASAPPPCSRSPAPSARPATRS